MDLLGEALTHIAENPHRYGRCFDAAEVLRLQVRPLLVSRLVRQAFDQLRQAAADNPAVSIRLLSTLGRLKAKITEPGARAVLLEQADAVWETAISKNPVAMDRDDLHTAWQLARTSLLA